MKSQRATYSTNTIQIAISGYSSFWTNSYLVTDTLISYNLATAYRPLLVWPLKTKATGTGNESTAGQPNDDSNVSARQRQGN